MNDTDLDKKLKSVGKAAFVANYELFQNFSAGRVSRANAIETLVRKKSAMKLAQPFGSGTQN
ncbi:hypothetical protein ACTNIH_002317 [Vibrio parahaemolyticus]